MKYKNLSQDFVFLKVFIHLLAWKKQCNCNIVYELIFHGIANMSTQLDSMNLSPKENNRKLHIAWKVQNKNKKVLML